MPDPEPGIAIGPETGADITETIGGLGNLYCAAGAKPGKPGFQQDKGQDGAKCQPDQKCCQGFHVVPLRLSVVVPDESIDTID